jgi:hypothetical protein
VPTEVFTIHISASWSVGAISVNATPEEIMFGIITLFTASRVGLDISLQQANYEVYSVAQGATGVSTSSFATNYYSIQYVFLADQVAFSVEPFLPFPDGSWTT